MQTSYAEQLSQVRDSLTLDNWNKGSYFSNKNNILCMCVHGAGQALVNPEVKKALENNKVVAALVASDLSVDASLAGERAAGRASASVASAVAVETNNKLLELWSNRPDWIKQERIYNSISYGFVNLHYLMGMFGITASFNDSPNTTLDMLKDKLSEAANWAEANEEFLKNN